MSEVDNTATRQGGPGPLIVTRRQSDDVRALAAALSRGPDGVLRDAIAIGLAQLARKVPSYSADGAIVGADPELAAKVRRAQPLDTTTTPRAARFIGRRAFIGSPSGGRTEGETE